jgi:hypothetical protein
MSGYGAVDNKPKSSVAVGAAVGVVILAAVIAGLVYYEISDRRSRDASDFASLNAEMDALKTASEPLARLEAAATPDTKPEDYAKLVADAKVAYDAYASKPRRTSPLPSNRPWPVQFSNADRFFKDAVDKYAILTYYLDQRQQVLKNPGKHGTVQSDSDLRNLIGNATAAHQKLKDALAAMQTQRDSGEWDYSTKPPKIEAQ